MANKKIKEVLALHETHSMNFYGWTSAYIFLQETQAGRFKLEVTISNQESDRLFGEDGQFRHDNYKEGFNPREIAIYKNRERASDKSSYVRFTIDIDAGDPAQNPKIIKLADILARNEYFRGASSTTGVMVSDVSPNELITFIRSGIEKINDPARRRQYAAITGEQVFKRLINSVERGTPLINETAERLGSLIRGSGADSPLPTKLRNILVGEALGQWQRYPALHQDAREALFLRDAHTPQVREYLTDLFQWKRENIKAETPDLEGLKSILHKHDSVLISDMKDAFTHNLCAFAYVAGHISAQIDICELLEETVPALKVDMSKVKSDEARQSKWYKEHYSAPQRAVA